MEGWISSLTKAFGAETDSIRRKMIAERKVLSPLSEQALLSGPQFGMDAASQQSEIDAMFGESG
ncbi:MAG: hypothetical protein FD153_1267 [Rhodospirillaceae bacterium]|nr:MAG: hypothetical protein FD153_1267 [Rhodospirillaceae bacterium]